MPKFKKPKDSKNLTKILSIIASDKLAKGIIVLDLTSIEFSPCDYFIIATCETDNHTRAIANEMVSLSKEINLIKPRSEGYEAGQWIIIDYYQVVVHLMLEETRLFYKLENLWADAKFYQLSQTNRLIKVDKEKIRELITIS